MATPLQRAYRFCMGDGSLTLAVCILIFFVFVLYPMVEVGVIRRFWLDLVFAAFLALGAMFVFEPRPIVRMFLIFLAGSVAASLLEHFFDHAWLTALRSLLTMLAAGFLGALLLARVMRDGRMNLNRIMGAIGSYLLIGIIFTQAYRLLAAFVAGRVCHRRSTRRLRRDQPEAVLLQLHNADVDRLWRHHAVASLCALAGHDGSPGRQLVSRRARGAAGRTGNRLASRTAGLAARRRGGTQGRRIRKRTH